MAHDATLTPVSLADCDDTELLEELTARGLTMPLSDADDTELLEEARSRDVLLADDVLNQADWVKLYHLLRSGQEAGALQMVRAIVQNVTGRVLP